MSKSQKPVQDERVTMEENKYRSEALLVVETVLVLSIITKEYILKLPLESSTTDWILLILAVVYPFVRGPLFVWRCGSSTYTTASQQSRPWSGDGLGGGCSNRDIAQPSTPATPIRCCLIRTCSRFLVSHLSR